jgi:squalene-associated FAD-dependent desaturase
MAEIMDCAAARPAVTRPAARCAHVIGGGIAGLSAAVALTRAGWTARVYEAGPAAGGRCRSYFDRALGMRIDNGNHLLLSGNDAAMGYLRAIGAADSLGGPDGPVFPFMDLASGERWTLRLSRGRVPWWILSARRRVPGTRLGEYLGLLALPRAPKGASVAAALGGGVLYRRLLEPLAVAALNTPAESGLAALLGAVVDGTLLRGGAACWPRWPRVGLSESFVDPAVAWLAAQGGSVATGRRIAGLAVTDGQVVGLETTEGTVPVAPGEPVVLAVPPWVAPDLLPGLIAPDGFEAILNIHFRVSVAPGEVGFLGLVGGLAEWIFIKPGVVSVTVSAANRVLDVPAETIAARVWADVRAALTLAEPMPPVRVVKEKRATFAADAAQEARRPEARTALRNLVLAGDWTATGLPATIEGAIRSGQTAAKLLGPA